MKNMQTSLPTVYVLMRTFRSPEKDNHDVAEYYAIFEDAIDSVEKNSAAYEGVVRLVINDDSPKSGWNYDEHKNVLSDILERHGICQVKSNLYFSETDAIGSSYATFKVRKDFLCWSEENSDLDSITVSLDQDDVLTESALSNIVGEIKRTEGNICISAYETEDDSKLSIIKDNGKGHNSRALQLHLNPQPLTREADAELLTGIDTLGWTKSWTRTTISLFVDHLETFLNECRGGVEPYFSKYRAYEDFLDTMILLKKGVRLCGMPTPTHRYRKQPQSITATPTFDDFRYDRAANLVTLNDLSHFCADELVNEYESLLRQFISYKIKVIEGILSDYRAKYLLRGESRYQTFADETTSGYFIEQLCRHAQITAARDASCENDSMVNLTTLYHCPCDSSCDFLSKYLERYLLNNE